MTKTFTHYRQHDAMDCGPTCLRMVAKYYGKTYSIHTLRTQAEYSKEGVSLLGIAHAADGIGFKTTGVQLNYKQLTTDVALPAILHWGQNHFVVIYKVHSPLLWRGVGGEALTIADPAKNKLITLTKNEFLQHWASSTDEDGHATGMALLLEPLPEFYKQAGEQNKKLGWGMLLQHLSHQRRYIFQLVMGLLVGSLLQLIFPYLTQSIVDTGINTQNIHFIYIVLLAQFMLMFSRSVVEFIRSRILLHISTKINIQLLSSFWIKLMRLPLHYFDTKSTGDIQQRLSDQHRIESFLTGSTLSTFFSLFTFFIFTIVLLQYNSMVFFIFAIGSVLYYLWIRIFLKQRASLDYKRFAISAKENTATMQLIQGMQEIKLNNATQLKRWEWEGLQASLFKLQFKSLSLSQWQQAGAFFINEGKNIIITFFVAKAVIEGSLTLGQMLAIQYILGQLNSPIEQMIGFAQQFQDAKLSLERLNEIHELEDEGTASPNPSKGGGYGAAASLNPSEGGTLLGDFSGDKASPNPSEGGGYGGDYSVESFSDAMNFIAPNKSIQFNNITFTYPGAGNEPVLKNVNLVFPAGKVTAIVGTSGSGKTTILKLIQKFYDTYHGEISIGNTNLVNLHPHYWRSISSSVMQEGFIFNDSIAKNIAVSEEYPNYDKLVQACKVANVLDFVEQLPLGFNTKIGAEGNGISTGQKQRILIARAVYKNPPYLFFDEATNSLDANNETAILKNLQHFFEGRTVIIVAHRLSTVKNADKIIVLHQGQVTEQGTHDTLVALKRKYYELVKNQLELGN